MPMSEVMDQLDWGFFADCARDEELALFDFSDTDGSTGAPAEDEE